MKAKEELLKIYSAYLPYGLQITEGNSQRTLTGIKLWADDNLCINYDYSIYSALGNFKPILYSMEMLTQEIEHKGEMFIPKKRLGFNENDILCLKAWGEYSGRLLHKDFEQLVEWHFNVFGLEESEYIKK